MDTKILFGLFFVVGIGVSAPCMAVGNAEKVKLLGLNRHEAIERAINACKDDELRKSLKDAVGDTDGIATIELYDKIEKKTAFFDEKTKIKKNT